MDWFPVVVEQVALTSLANGAQATLLDSPIQNQGGTPVPYDSGAIVGLRTWIAVQNPAVNTTQSLRAVAMILPVGMTVPAVITSANMKTAERYIWFGALLETKAQSASATFSEKSIEIHSSRRFDQNDRLVIVIVNDGAALSATAVGGALVDSYVREA